MTPENLQPAPVESFQPASRIASLGNKILEFAQNIRYKTIPIAASVVALASSGPSFANSNEPISQNIEDNSLVGVPSLNFNGNIASSQYSPGEVAKKVRVLYEKYPLVASVNTSPGRTNVYYPSKKNWKVHAWISPAKKQGKPVYRYSLRNSKFGSLMVSYTTPDEPTVPKGKFPQPTRKTKNGGYYWDKIGTSFAFEVFAKPNRKK